MAIQFNRSPETDDVTELKVFISYKTKEDYNYAKSIRNALTSLGFQTIFLEPYPYDPNRNDEVERRKLFDLILDADFICIITTYDSLKSHWVGFEFKEAATLIGRVIFICPKEPISGYEAVDKLGLEGVRHK